MFPFCAQREDPLMFCSVVIDSPVGHLTVSGTSEAIVSIAWTDDPHGEPNALLSEARRQLEAYFAGRLTEFDLPLMITGSPFDKRVWETMRRIPYGQTRSYGELAMEVGSAPRAIGGACGRNRIPLVIPCHRVLASNGLGGFSGGAGLPTKRQLLQLEGAAAQSTSLRAHGSGQRPARGQAPRSNPADTDLPSAEIAAALRASK
jgi:methylated-DNA-[protein]-cysteine S-methyltransferase